MESSVPSVSKLVSVFAASWDGLRETFCVDVIEGGNVPVLEAETLHCTPAL